MLDIQPYSRRISCELRPSLVALKAGEQQLRCSCSCATALPALVPQILACCLVNQHRRVLHIHHYHIPQATSCIQHSDRKVDLESRAVRTCNVFPSTAHSGWMMTLALSTHLEGVVEHRLNLAAAAAGGAVPARSSNSSGAPHQHQAPAPAPRAHGSPSQRQHRSRPPSSSAVACLYSSAPLQQQHQEALLHQRHHHRLSRRCPRPQHTAIHSPHLQQHLAPPPWHQHLPSPSPSRATQRAPGAYPQHPRSSSSSSNSSSSSSTPSRPRSSSKSRPRQPLRRPPCRAACCLSARGSRGIRC